MSLHMLCVNYNCTLGKGVTVQAVPVEHCIASSILFVIFSLLNDALSGLRLHSVEHEGHK